jgi:hypothetical protein
VIHASSLAIAAALLGLASWAVGAEEDHGRPKDDDPGPKAALPLAQVILYSSGVGYFQRDGQVDGRTELELRFKTEDINDLLKSLVVQDRDGGRVTGVTYGSRDPITKILKSFSIDLTSNPTLGQLLGQVRGERVEVSIPAAVTGIIVGVETKVQPAGEDKVVQVEYLNLLTDEGLRSVPLGQVQRITLKNERLDAELRQALAVLAAGHDTQKKTVTIGFDGQGKRRVRVAYIVETPVWKTSYRLVLDDEDRPFLQGWAIVENMTDDDWKDVQISLISGRPVSFVMDLYQPLYASRPVVVPELFAGLRPQVYGEALEKAPVPPGAAATPMVMPAPARPMMRRGAMMEAAPPMATPEAARLGVNIQEGVTAAAWGAQAGELFEYTIKASVSLERQKSAMLPILSQAVEGQKVSIYNPAVQPKHPLNGFRLKNATPLHLMQGPITVFDAGAYAGDARIEDLAPSQERLLSYALDLKTECKVLPRGGQQDLITVKLRKGTLIATRKAAEAVDYTVRNRDRKPKVVLVEHPFHPDWKLTEPTKAPERSRDVYRFPVEVAADTSATLRVREERQFDERVELTNLDPNVIAIYLRAPAVGEKVKEALRKVVELRDRVAQTAAERGRREQRVNEIGQEQSRIRENMGKLAQNSDLYNRYIKKLDKQETELDDLRKEIAQLQDTEARQQRELEEYLLGLEVE